MIREAERQGDSDLAIALSLVILGMTVIGVILCLLADSGVR